MHTGDKSPRDDKIPSDLWSEYSTRRGSEEGRDTLSKSTKCSCIILIIGADWLCGVNLLYILGETLQTISSSERGRDNRH